MSLCFGMDRGGSRDLGYGGGDSDFSHILDLHYVGDIGDSDFHHK